MLLATKVQVPPPRPGLVPRRRLLRQLERASRQLLTLIAAPAGAGKTSLLSAWAGHQRRPPAWLSLEAADDEPRRFWRYVIAALAEVERNLDDEAGALLRSPAPVPLMTVLTVLLNRLAGRAGRLVLVIDDYHLIAAPAIHETLLWLLEHAPAGFHLVLAARGRPGLPLARLRAGGRLAELDAAELRFDAEEATTLLRVSWPG